MKKLLFLSVLAALLSAPVAQARVGGGRSFGSRGSRGTAPRYSPPQRNFGGHAYRSSPAPAPAPYVPRPVPPPSPLDPRYGSGGGFWHGLAGGLAGGMIGSWIFGRHGGYGYGGGYAPGYGGGFFGFFEILILLGIGYLAFRWFRGRQYAGPVGGLYSAAPSPIYSAPPESEDGEPSLVTDDPDTLLARHEKNYQPEAFLEARTDDFFRIQAAFMARDLTSVRQLLAPEAVSELEREIAELQANGRVNRLENITVRQTDLAEAWEEAGKLFVTVHFKANLLDYVVDEKSGAVVGGSRTEPVKFEEYWTFERGIGFAADSTQWRLGAIQQS